MNKSQWFAEILRSFEKPLVRFAVRKVPKDIAQELAQETFLRLWREDVHRLEGREGPWLFSVCRNLCLDWLKSEGKRKSKSVEDMSLADPAEPVLQQMMREEEESQVQKMVNSLSENQKEVLRLKFQEGFSYKEISQITGHSESYVGVLIHEAMMILRKEVGNEISNR